MQSGLTCLGSERINFLSKKCCGKKPAWFWAKAFRMYSRGKKTDMMHEHEVCHLALQDLLEERSEDTHCEGFT